MSAAAPRPNFDAVMAFITVFWLQLSAIVAFILFVITALLPFLNSGGLTSPNFPEAGSFQAAKHNVWADFSRSEAQELTEFLLFNSELNLTEASKATSNDNKLFLLELLQPNKTDVLNYLNGSSGPPDRWARVVIDQGAIEPAQYVILAAGPLPVSKLTRIHPLSWCYNSGRNHVLNPNARANDLRNWLVQYFMNASDITLELLGKAVDPSHPNALNVGGRTVPYQNGSVSSWVEVMGNDSNPDSRFLLPQGLYTKIFVEGRDPKKWQVLEWYYNDVIYESADHLREAMKGPLFKKNSLNLGGDWTALEDFSEGLPDRKKPPPVMIHPSGARYKVDEKEKFVSWMGFDFFLATSSDIGLSLHNIRFNGDSILFELGLQETYVTYAASDPVQGGQDFIDSTFQMGRLMVELVPGYDCPAYATFLSTEYHREGQTTPRKNGICIFEYTADHPLHRHTSESMVSIGRNTYLVVRSVMTVGNYDYTFDYVFYLDGTIEVKVRASGFIFGLFWNENILPHDEYGYRTHDAAASAMHDHVLNFKADLDVAGASNTMVRVGIEPMTKRYSWEDGETTPRNTMHLVPRTVKKETGINWAPNSAEMLLVLNDNATNSWGEKRGYRIQPGIGTPSHRINPNSTTSGIAVEWATQDIWVLKRKDTEPKSSSIFQPYNIADPLVNFRKFVDDEDIVDEDLVVFFNLGHHHVPHSGDIPNTLMHTAGSSVMFTPFNFHDRDPTRRSAQGVRIDTSKEGTEVRYYGGRYHDGVSLKETDLEPDQSQYAGARGGSLSDEGYGSTTNLMKLAFGIL